MLFYIVFCNPHIPASSIIPFIYPEQPVFYIDLFLNVGHQPLVWTYVVCYTATAMMCGGNRNFWPTLGICLKMGWNDMDFSSFWIHKYIVCSCRCLYHSGIWLEPCLWYFIIEFIFINTQMMLILILDDSSWKIILMHIDEASWWTRLAGVWKGAIWNLISFHNRDGFCSNISKHISACRMTFFAINLAVPPPAAKNGTELRMPVAKKRLLQKL